MVRTVQTLEIISKQIKYKKIIQTDNNLMENDGGLLTVGKTTDEMDKYYSMDIITKSRI